MLRPGNAQGDLWHRLLCFAQYRRTPVASKHRLLTTIAYQLGGERHYALEGSIFVAGAAVQWLRDSLRVVQSAEETGALAAAADPTQEVISFRPSSAWARPIGARTSRGALFGLTRATGPRELAQAALESVCFQTVDLLGGDEGGLAQTPRTRSRLYASTAAWPGSDWTMQRLADLIGSAVDRPQIKETTALGAAYLAGLHAGFFPEPDRFLSHWRLERRFTPQMDAATRERKLTGLACGRPPAAGVKAVAGHGCQPTSRQDGGHDEPHGLRRRRRASRPARPGCVSRRRAGPR